jgi:hypothetical protein
MNPNHKPEQITATKRGFQPTLKKQIKNSITLTRKISKRTGNYASIIQLSN